MASKALWRSMFITLAVAFQGCSERTAKPPGEVFDAGPVFASSTPTLIRDFRVLNATSRVVRILGESHSCTCTSIRLGSEVLQPGDSTTLTMVVNIPEGYAKREVVTVLKTDHPRFPEWSYRLRFESFPQARLVPERIELGELRARGVKDWDVISAEAMLEVFAAPGEKLPELGESFSSAPELSIELSEQPRYGTLPSGVQKVTYRLTARLAKQPMTPGYNSTQVFIPVEGQTSASATVTWTFLTPLECLPPKLHFGMIGSEDAPGKRTVLIRSTNGQSFRVLSVDGGFPRVRVTASEGQRFPTPSSKVHTLEFEIDKDGGKLPAVLSEVARIKTDVHVLPEVSIAWSVFFGRSVEKTEAQETRELTVRN